MTLLAVGRLKAGPERELFSRYVERAQVLARPVGLSGVVAREIDESRARSAADRKRDEAAALRAALPARARLIALDERGRSVTSTAFAEDLGRARDEGATDFALVIGGPDGLDDTLRQSADRVIAYGAATFPHQIVRVLAAEQIYRALTILAGHPYHRA